MFWTKLVKTVSMIILAILLFASLICGCMLMSDNQEGMGLLVIIGGSALSVISISMTMMLTEISTNIYKIKNELCGEEEAEEEIESDNTSLENDINIDDMRSFPFIQPNRVTLEDDINPDDVDESLIWICNNCGKKNFIYQSRCSFCDVEHEED